MKLGTGHQHDALYEPEKFKPAPPIGKIKYPHAYNFGCGQLIFTGVTFLDF